MSHVGGHQIKVRLENESGVETVEFTAHDVLSHNGETRSWEEIGNDPSHQFAQVSLAEDYALYFFRRRHGDQSNYRVDVLSGLTESV
jgi:hypothetical protein